MLSGPVHLDPDLRPGLRKINTSTSALLFGQDGGPQTILEGAGVREGDLFLFFGWFRESERPNEKGEVCFRRGATNWHVIWGWLQVQKPAPINRTGTLTRDIACLHHHPHIEDRNRSNNCVYVATRELSFLKGTGGGGIFPKYHESLRLTAPNEERRSHWCLPHFFQNVDLGFHRTRDASKWEPRLNGLHGKSVGRGQEFVFNTGGVQAEVAKWLSKLFANVV
jgi:hypothetical protein